MTGIVPLRPRKCPQCGKPAVEEFRPFCSRRCAHLDLAKWLNEDYRIAAVDDPDPDDDSFPDDA